VVKEVGRLQHRLDHEAEAVLRAAPDSEHGSIRRDLVRAERTPVRLQPEFLDEFGDTRRAGREIAGRDRGHPSLGVERDFGGELLMLEDDEIRHLRERVAREGTDGLIGSERVRLLTGDAQEVAEGVR
jgi:hypothetical protein